MVNWEGSFTNEGLQVRSGEPVSTVEFAPPVFATRLVAKEAVLEGKDGWDKLEKLRRHLKGMPGVNGSAWQDVFDIERILSSAEAVRLVPMR